MIPWPTHRFLWLSAALGFALVVSGCGGGAEAAGETPIAAEAKVQPEAEQATTPEAERAATTEAERAAAPEAESGATAEAEQRSDSVETPQTNSEDVGLGAFAERTEGSLPQSLTGGLLANPGQRTNWRITIGGTIGGDLWLAQEGVFIRGQITYDNSEVPVDVVGHRFNNGNSYFFHEINPDGSLGGTADIREVFADSTLGDMMWRSDTGLRELAITFEGFDPVPYVLDPVIQPGLYEFSIPTSTGEQGPFGRLTISSVDANSATVEFVSANGGPDFNQAVIDTVTVPHDNNVLRFEISNSSVNCAIDTIVLDGFAVAITQIGRTECGFDFAASVAGIYVLTEPA